MESDTEVPGVSKQTPSRKSSVWKHFDIVDNGKKLASCGICRKVLSFRTTISNLKKHFDLKHIATRDEYENDDFGDDSVDECTKPVHDIQKCRSSIWKYFSVADKTARKATCNSCYDAFSYKTSITNLKRHLYHKHKDLYIKMIRSFRDDSGKESDSDLPVHNDKEQRLLTAESDEESSDYDLQFEADEDDGKLPNRRASAWYFFKCLDPVLKISQCLICKRRLSFVTVSNLKRHLEKRHPNAMPQLKDGTEIIIAADGQFYEVERNSFKNNNEDNDQNIPEKDPIYCEDYGQDHTIEMKPLKKRKTVKNSRENRWNGNSDDDANGKTPTSDKQDSLNHFANYVTSLLRQLPKTISDQLQSDIIKQIMTAKISNELTGSATAIPSSSYSITITSTEKDRVDGLTDVLEGKQ